MNCSNMREYSFRLLFTVKHRGDLHLFSLSPFHLELCSTWWNRIDIYSKLKDHLKDEILPYKFPFCESADKGSSVYPHFLMYKPLPIEGRERSNLEFIKFDFLPSDIYSIKWPDPELPIMFHCKYNVPEFEEVLWDPLFILINAV